MPEYLSGRKRKQNIGINSYSENTDSLKVVGNVLVSSGKIGIGTTVPTEDLDLSTIRVRNTLYDSTNSGGVFGYFLTKDNSGIKWVEVPPINTNAIFVAENNNILGVSSFIGLNIVSDDLLGVIQNPENPNFADIIIRPRWAKSGESGIYTTKNVGIGTTIPTADFQVGFGTTGVTIDGSSGVVTAIGYFGEFADFDNLIVGLTTIRESLDVIGLGVSEVSVYLASAGGITTTGGDLYVGGQLFAGRLEIGNLEVENINVTGISTFNIANINVGVATDINVTGIATVNDLNVSGITSTKNVYVDGDIFVSGNTTTQNLYAQTGIITNLTSEVSSIDTLTAIGATIETLDVSTIVGVSTLIGVGSAFFPEGSFDNLTSIAATITSLNVSDLVGVSATITSLNSTNYVGSAATINTLNSTSGNITNLVSTSSTITSLRVQSGIVTNLIGTAATITSLNVQSGTVTNLVSTSSTITNLRVQSGIVTNLVSTAGTFTTLNSTSGNFGNVQVSGIVTAPSFVGNLTGNVDTADYADLSGISTNVIGGIASVTSLNVSGIASISELNVVDEFDVYANDSVFHQNVVIQGNLTVNGTEVIINVDEKFIKDRQIVLGFSTTNSVDDDTANGGGFAIASTEGSPLVSLYAVGVNTLPDTYKKLIWTRANTYGAGTTDAFMFNYAVGIGSTLVPNDVRLAVGGVQITDDTVDAEFFSGDGSQLTSLNADEISSGTLDNERLPDNINISGIMTALEYFGTFKGVIDIGVILENANYAQVAGVATYAANAGIATYAVNAGVATYADTAGISTYAVNAGIATYALNAGIATYAVNAGIATYADIAGISTYAVNAGITTNVIGGIASVSQLNVSGGTQLGIVTATEYFGVFKGSIDVGVILENANYAQVAGVATYAANAGIATYADTAGISTYAVNAGIATNVIGGIGSITSLSVSGVTTTNSLNVGTGGTIITTTVNGKVGIGTSTPTSTFNVLGTAEVTGELKVTSIGSTSGEHIEVKHYRDNGGSVVYQSGDKQLFSLSNDGEFAYVISDDDGRSILDITKTGITSIRESLSVGTTVTVGSGLTISENSFLRSLQATDIKFLSTGSSEATRITAKHYEDNEGSFVLESGENHLFSVDNDSDVYYSINDSEARPALTVSSSGITTIRDLFQNRVNFTSVGSTSDEQIQINHYRNIAYQSDIDNRGAISFDSPTGITTDGITYFPASLFALTNGGGNVFSVSGYNWFSGSPGIPSIDVTQSGRVGFGTTNPSIDIDIARETYFTGPNFVFRNRAQIQDTLILSENLSPGITSTTSIILEPITQGITTYAPTRSAAIFRGELDQNLNGGQLFTVVNDNSSLVTINRFVGLSSETPAPTGQRNIETVVEVRNNGNVGIGTTNPIAKFNVVGNSVLSGITTLGITSTTNPTTNSTMSFELTNNTTLTVRVRGTDGVVRTGIVTLA